MIVYVIAAADPRRCHVSAFDVVDVARRVYAGVEGRVPPHTAAAGERQVSRSDEPRQKRGLPQVEEGRPG